MIGLDPQHPLNPDAPCSDCCHTVSQHQVDGPADGPWHYGQCLARNPEGWPCPCTELQQEQAAETE